MVNIYKVIIGYIGITLVWVWLFKELKYYEITGRFMIILLSLGYSTISDKSTGIFHYCVREGFNEN